MTELNETAQDDRAFAEWKAKHDAAFPPTECDPRCDSLGHEARCHWAGDDHSDECLLECWNAAQASAKPIEPPDPGHCTRDECFVPLSGHCNETHRDVSDRAKCPKKAHHGYFANVPYKPETDRLLRAMTEPSEQEAETAEHADAMRRARTICDVATDEEVLAVLRGLTAKPIDASDEHHECGHPWDEHVCPDTFEAAVEDATRAIERQRQDPMPLPPHCNHPERPDGKPLCGACWEIYRPEFEAWSEGRRKPIDAPLLHANRHKLIGETERSERPARIREGWLWCVDPDCTYTEPEVSWCKPHGEFDRCWVTKADQDAVERGHSYEDQTGE